MLHAALTQWLLLPHATLLLQKFCHFVQLLLHRVPQFRYRCGSYNTQYSKKPTSTTSLLKVDKAPCTSAITSMSLGALFRFISNLKNSTLLQDPGPLQHCSTAVLISGLGF